MKTKTIFLLPLLSIMAILSSCSDNKTPTIQEIHLSPSEISIKIEEQQTLKVSYLPAGLSEPAYEWSSSNNDIVSVKDGLILGIREGEALLTVIDPETGLESTCKVTVLPIEPSSIKLSVNEKTMEIGETFNLDYNITPENTTHKDLEWLSDDIRIASIKDGVITAISDGKCNIIAKIKGTNLSDTCKIEINPIKVSKITLDKTTATIEKGQSIAIKASILPINAKDKSIIWESNNTNVAKVKNGIVTATGKGNCTITANTNDGGFKATCALSVLPASVRNIELNSSSIKILIGESTNIQYSIYPEYAENKSVTWKSSNPDIVSIDNSGQIIALKKGTSIITATTNDGNHTATCEVSSIEITELIKLGIQSSSLVSINGYVSGNIYCYIRNASSSNIVLTRFELRDSNTNNIKLYSEDTTKLGTLTAGSSINLGGRINSIYLPLFIWYFEYNGQKYQVSYQYQNN